MNEKKTAVLIALYNGAKHLESQLDSVMQQTCPPDLILGSDDGSSDDTRAVFEMVAKQSTGKIEITCLDGPKMGYARNFFHLLKSCPEDVEIAAFCDQDDVWLDHKLERGAEMLAACDPDRPALLGTATWVWRAETGRKTPSRKLPQKLGFQHALVQNFAGGNTLMLNKAGIELVRNATQNSPDVVAHDWFLYQIISGAGGTVLYDPEPSLLYRQHGGNEIGANSGFGAFVKRFNAMLDSTFLEWNTRNINALRGCTNVLLVENVQLLEAFAAGREGSVFSRLKMLRQTGLYRRDKVGQAGLWLAAILGRL
ncbi:MAG: glycosyltransferase [Pseudomonadota bacterium]